MPDDPLIREALQGGSWLRVAALLGVYLVLRSTPAAMRAAREFCVWSWGALQAGQAVRDGRITDLETRIEALQAARLEDAQRYADALRTLFEARLEENRKAAQALVDLVQNVTGLVEPRRPDARP